MPMQVTQVLPSQAAGIAQAADLLRAGGLVAFATETVYGLGADARNGEAVAGIYSAKGRPRFNPLIVHVPDAHTAQKYVQWSDEAECLAQAFWPGALTLVLPLKHGHGLSPLVTAGLDTLAIRVPAHDGARALLQAARVPVAAPSANPSGRISPTTAQHVIDGLDGKIAAVLDAGPCRVGLESTIIALTPSATLLRPGGVAAEDIQEIVGHEILQPTPNKITAPGQLLSHYAPRAQVRLNATQAHPGEIMLGFGKIAGELNLSPTGDLLEAAARLFEHLHQLDRLGQPIAVAPIPKQGLGSAINDRLKRAAAPR